MGMESMEYVARLPKCSRLKDFISLILPCYFVPCQIIAAIYYRKMKPKPKLLYFRSKSKSTYALRFNKGVNVRHLQSLLSKRESILLENIIMIHKGKVVDSNHSLQDINENGIIHVVDLAQVKKDTAKFHLKGLDGSTHVHQVRAEMKVKDFIKENLHKIDKIPYFYIGLVYVGKLLSPDRTFFQEFVEQDCEIIVVNILEQASKRKLDKEVKKYVSGTQQEEILLKGARLQADKNEDNGNEVSEIDDKNDAVSAQPHIQAEVVQKQPEKPAVNDPLLVIAQSGPPIQLNIHLQGNNNDKNEQQPAITSEQVDNIPHPASPPFNIQVSQVDSVDSDQQQRNQVQFYQEEDPFDALTSHHQSPQSLPSATKEKLGESPLGTSDFIFAGTAHTNQTKSFIQNLMKKYKIMFQ